jgi:uncharacterized protein (DUF1778 family)
MKNKLVHIRCDENEKKFIELASKKSYSSISRFIMATAIKTAEEILGLTLAKFKRHSDLKDD